MKVGRRVTTHVLLPLGCASARDQRLANRITNLLKRKADDADVVLLEAAPASSAYLLASPANDDLFEVDFECDFALPKTSLAPASPAWTASPAYCPASPAYCPASPAYCPASPAWTAYCPASPALTASPAYSPASPAWTASPAYSPASPALSYSPASSFYSPASSVYSPASSVYSPASPGCCPILPVFDLAGSMPDFDDDAQRLLLSRLQDAYDRMMQTHTRAYREDATDARDND